MRENEREGRTAEAVEETEGIDDLCELVEGEE